jgi:Glycosyltransferase like family
VTRRDLVSVVMCSIDPDKYAKVTANYSRLLARQPFEIIGIHDARSLAEGYSRGIAKSKGELLILSHDDIRILTPDFAVRVATHLASYDLVGIAGTTRVVGGSWLDAGDPYLYTLISSPEPESGRIQTVLLGGEPLIVPGIQALDGVFMAMHRRVAEAVGFDTANFDGFHLYDLDFSFRAYLTGYRLAVSRDIVLVHDSIGRYDRIWEQYVRRFNEKFRASLPTAWRPQDGARGSFFAGSDNEILARCQPDKLAPILRQITQANAALV